MSEKIAVVTGANSGIGKVAAKALLSDGVRDVEKQRNGETDKQRN